MGLKDIREKKGYTRRQLSEITGLNLRSLQDYEQGHKEVTSMKADSLYRLSLALECSMEDIIEPYYLDVEINSDSEKKRIDDQMKRLLTYQRKTDKQ